MCHLGETNYMPVDKTWGVLDPSGISISVVLWMWLYFLQYFYDRPDYSISLFFTVRRRPQVDIEEYNFLERIFSKTKLEERTWAKLVNLNTIRWYCDGPEPTPAAIKYEERSRQRKSVSIHIQFDHFLRTYLSSFSEMEDAKRKAAIRNQAAKRKETDRKSVV